MNKKELKKLSKSQLIEIILDQESRPAKTEQHLKAFDNPHTPSSKQLKNNTKDKHKEPDGDDNSSNKEKNKPRFPGKPKNSNGGGIKLLEPDVTKEHKISLSPISGLPLGDPVGFRIQRVCDFPDKPAQTIEHIIYRYKDPKTGEIVEPEVDLPEGIYGKNLKSIVIMLRDMINSNIKIAQFIRELGMPSFSHATVKNIAAQSIMGLTPERGNIIKELKGEDYLNRDETTMRSDGLKRDAWGFFSKTAAIFSAGVTRAAYNLRKLIRNIRSLVIVVDGYGGYGFYPLKQRCWPHLIRMFKDFAKKNDEIQEQYER